MVMRPLRQWLRRLFGKQPGRPFIKQRRQLAVRGRSIPTVETLEDRVVPATSAFFSMPTNLSGNPGTVVSVPLTINHLFDAAGDQGLSGGDAILTYDPTVFSVSNSDIS